MASDAAAPHVVNVSCAVTGHVDAGKTSLVRALSTVFSTAALDKAPQSQARGITLDLGFSAFEVPAPAALTSLSAESPSRMQFTLVDCPGHASLIKTVIGGAQIMDMMLLVVDAVKGFQTQTAECLVIGEITTDVLIVVLNKIDMLPVEGRAAAIERAAARVKKVLASTKFSDAPIIALSAAPGGAGKLGAAAPSPLPPRDDSSIDELRSLMAANVRLRTRDAVGPFLFAVDHCFPVRGHGTVLTGTVLAGSISVGGTIEVPSLREEFKVKSMQMFRRPVSRIVQGDRAGVCVSGLEPSSLERGLACLPGSVPSLNAAVALVKRIRFFKGDLASECRVHLTIGHSTTMATAVFFGARDMAVRAAEATADATSSAVAAADADDAAAAIVDADSCGVGDRRAGSSASAAASSALSRSAARGIPTESFVWGSSWEWQEALLGGRDRDAKSSTSAEGVGGGAAPSVDGAPLIFTWQWAALLFDSPVLAPVGSLVIGARLDADIHVNACRLAFYGRLAAPLPPPSAGSHALEALNFFRWKLKRGEVDRVERDDDNGVSFIGRGLFKKETDMNLFAGLIVHSRVGQVGVIEGAFGKSGKFKVSIAKPSHGDPRAAAIVAGRATLGIPSGSVPLAAPSPVRVGDQVFLRYKKPLFRGTRVSSSLQQK